MLSHRPYTIFVEGVMYRYFVVALVLILVGVSALGAQKVEKFTITLDVPSRGNVALTLDRHDAFAPGSRIQVMTPRGIVLVDPSSVKVYRGSLPNEPKSFVVLAVSKSGSLIGSIQSGTEVYNVRRDPMASSPLTVTHNDVTANSCGVKDEKISNEVMRFMHEKPTEQSQGDEMLEMQIAVEADYQFFQKNDLNRDNALAYIAQVIGATSAIYERDFNVRITTTNVRLWEDSTDPYPEDGNSYSLLTTFIEHYEATMSSVPRDIAVYMTIRGGLGGVAKSIGGICEPGSSYAFGDLVSDLANAPNTYSWDQVLFAHEIGHVCGAVHTQNCFWPGGPLDSCYTSEGGKCLQSEQLRAIVGTIMSYCHLRRNDGGGIAAEFHPRHKHVVRAYLERASCIGARAAAKSNVLRGRLIDKATQNGIAGAELHIRVFQTDIFLGTLPLGIDTVEITAVDGSFEFTGLSEGIYTVVLPMEWAVTPVSIIAAEQGVNVIIGDDVVQRDIVVTKGRPVTIELITGGDSSDVTFIIVSQNIEALVENLTVPGSAAAMGVGVTRSLPIGSYTVVPHAVGRRFTPLYLDVDVTDSEPMPELSFTSTSTSPDSTALIVAISSINNGGVRSLEVGDDIELSLGADAIVANKPTGKNGVAVFEGMPSIFYELKCTIDTLVWVSTSESAISTDARYASPVMFEKRERRMPLIARPYQLAVTNETYTPLTGAERIIGPKMPTTRLPAILNLPFEVNFGATRSSKMFVYHGGDIVFGQRTLSRYIAPWGSHEEADFIVSTFSTRLGADSTALSETGVWWKISGEAPNRTIVVEWRKLKLCRSTNNCTDIGTFSFQVHVEENTGIIRMVFGEIEVGSLSIPCTIGLRGRDQLDARAIAGQNVGHDWSAPPTVSFFADRNDIPLNKSTKPVSGLTYTWFSAAVGVDDDASAQDGALAHAIRISPLPASDELVVKGLPQGARLRLVDMLGCTVLTYAALNTTAQIDVRALSSGQYLLLVETAHNTIIKTVTVTR